MSRSRHPVEKGTPLAYKRHGRCAACGRPIRGAFAGTPVCRQACGHVLALRLVEAEPGVLSLLLAPGVYVRRDLESSLAMATLPDDDERLGLIGLAADVADIDPALAIGHLDAAMSIVPGARVLVAARDALAVVPGAAP